jgi:hypothetical protein
MEGWFKSPDDTRRPNSTTPEAEGAGGQCIVLFPMESLTAAWVSGIGGGDDEEKKAGPVEDIRGIGVEVGCMQWLALLVNPRHTGPHTTGQLWGQGEEARELRRWLEVPRASARGPPPQLGRS